MSELTPVWSDAKEEREDLLDIPYEEPRLIPEGTQEQKARARPALFPRVGMDSEEMWSERKGDYARALAKVRCPACGRMNAPLLSPKTVWVVMDWEWVGLEYRQPFTDYLCVCPGCRREYVLHVYSPQ